MAGAGRAWQKWVEPIACDYVTPASDLTPILREDLELQQTKTGNQCHAERRIC